MADFSIATLAAGGGVLGIAPMPGRGGTLAADLRVLATWRPGLVLSLTRRARTAALGAALAEAGIAWRHFPVADFGVPAPDAPWAPLSEAARAVLAGRGRVLVHCAGGCGRSGMVALRLMVESGEAPQAALTRLRAARPCAVETAAQQAWAFAGAPG